MVMGDGRHQTSAWNWESLFLLIIHRQPIKTWDQLTNWNAPSQSGQATDVGSGKGTNMGQGKHWGKNSKFQNPSSKPTKATTALQKMKSHSKPGEFHSNHEKNSNYFR